jgi:hypothetical protein
MWRLEDLVPPSAETIIRLGGGGNYRVYYRSANAVGEVYWEMFLAEFSDGRWRMLRRIGEVSNANLVEIARALPPPVVWCAVLRKEETANHYRLLNGEAAKIVQGINLDVPPGTPLEEP